jgi:hypothetical protein
LAVAECKDDDEECKKRKKSSLISDDDYKKCHSFTQKKACGDDEDCGYRKKSGLISDDDYKKCHSSAQKEQSAECKGQRAQIQKNPEGAKSDPICSSSGWCGEEWPHAKAERDKIVQYPVDLPLDKDIIDSQTHLKDQEADKGAWTMNKEPSAYGKKPAQKKEKSEVMDKTKLQTEVDVRSDPPHNSDDGYETRYMNPSDPKDIVEYKTDNALDSDIIATQKHYKSSEKTEGHNFDPVKFLAQTKEDNFDVASADPQSLSDLAPQISIPTPNSIVQAKSYSKNAVKS